MGRSILRIHKFTGATINIFRRRGDQALLICALLDKDHTLIDTPHFDLYSKPLQKLKNLKSLFY